MSEHDPVFEAPITTTEKELLAYHGVDHFRLPDVHKGRCHGCRKRQVWCVCIQPEISFCEECLAAEFHRNRNFNHREAVSRAFPWFSEPHRE